MRAFIAAPLIGTIIFLSAVLFTINLTRLEAADTTRVVNDAYHNRIVSLIEIYRTDLNSVFRETIRRQIEEFILEPGWQTLKLTNKDIFTGQFINYQKIRKNRCEAILSTSKQIVCSIGRAPTADEQSLRNSFGYGIPAWVEVVNQTFTFEGIRFTPGNPQEMKLLHPDQNSYAEVSRYYQKCNNEFVKENAFDCDTFARQPGRYQCKDKTGRIIQGCSQGTFLLRIEPTEDREVYAALPRIVGDDGFGNTVRSGAIADDTIYLPINVRVYKYDDYALEFYKGLAFSNREGGAPEGPQEGIVDGLCFGTDVGCADKLNKRSRRHHGGKQGRDLQKEVALAFRSGALQAAIKNIKAGTLPNPLLTNEGLDFRLLLSSRDPNKCETGNPQCKRILLENPTADDLVDSQVLDPKPGLGPDNQPVAYYADTTITFFVYDENVVYQVRGNTPNKVTYVMEFKQDGQLR